MFGKIFLFLERGFIFKYLKFFSLKNNPLQKSKEKQSKKIIWMNNYINQFYNITNFYLKLNSKNLIVHIKQRLCFSIIH